MPSPLLAIHGINKSFGGQRVLEDVSFSVRPGELVGLMGRNGSGKTTLFNLITRRLMPDCGTIQLSGVDVLQSHPWDLAKLGLARTFQEVRVAASLSVLDNVMMGYQRHVGENLTDALIGRSRWMAAEKQSQDEAEGLLEEFGLAGARNEPAQTLSFGQRKLLSLCTCLTMAPRCLLLDEPFAGISPANADKLHSRLSTIAEKHETAVIIIEHDTRVMRELCQRLIVLSRGRVIGEGSPASVLDDPEVIQEMIR